MIAFLLCKTSKGLFTDELVVSVKTTIGVISFFLDKRDVQNTQGQDRIEVRIIDRAKLYTVVELPKTPINSTSIVTVPTENCLFPLPGAA
jgi:hypothetical protein